MGKSKGSANEVKVAKSLGIWLYTDAKALHRSRGSGSMFHHGAIDECGDISPLRQGLYWPLSVECKKVETTCRIELLVKHGVKSQLYRWYIKNQREAHVAKRFPILIFSRNNFGQLCIMKDVVKCIRNVRPVWSVCFGVKRFIIVNLDDLTSQINSQKFLKNIKHILEKRYE